MMFSEFDASKQTWLFFIKADLVNIVYVFLSLGLQHTEDLVSHIGYFSKNPYAYLTNLIDDDDTVRTNLADIKDKARHRMRIHKEQYPESDTNMLLYLYDIKSRKIYATDNIDSAGLFLCRSVE